ncbi:hypothetical protein, partial [Intestinimonas butyriciproducens]|uniref:hypothetical protein n=1 Tax=Intestinimonas butyriciproducens TaxID=1297617 RepID=UPI00321A5AB5
YSIMVRRNAMIIKNALLPKDRSVLGRARTGGASGTGARRLRYAITVWSEDTGIILRRKGKGALRK